jgi:hypothetical protein
VYKWLNRYPELREAVQIGVDTFNPRVERALAERAIGFFVIPFSDSGVLDLPPTLLRRGRGNRCLLRNAARQPHGEHRTLAHLARHRDVAAHHLTEAPANPCRQTCSGDWQS